MSGVRSCGIAFLAWVVLSGGSAVAAAPHYGDILPLSRVRAGMTGYGLTVFRGTRISRFRVTVVGVVKKGSLVIPGHDMILVRMAGGPMTTRQANLIRGMSGSPVYIHGKIVGAFSQGEPATKEPLGGVTPIEDMLEAWDPKLPTRPIAALPDTKVRTVSLDRPLVLGDRRIDRIVYNVPIGRSLRSHGTTLVMHPCTSFATFSGFSKSAREKIARALEPYNVEVVQGAQSTGAKPDFKGAPLVPGAAFSMMLLTGDLSAGATGTVTYRRGNRILGFGHPFMGIGPIEAPLCSAYVYDVYPLLTGSYKISSPGPVVGSSTQDRNFSVSGVIGMRPNTVPVTVDVRDRTTGRSRVFHAQAVGHPNLYAAMVSGAVGSAVAEVHPVPGPVMARITTDVDAEEIGRVTRTNLVYDARAIDAAATGDLDDLLGILTGNPFYPLGIRSASVRVEIEPGRRTAQVERIFVKEGKFEPGQTLDVGIVLKPYKQPQVTRMVKLAIPANATTGRYALQVRGAAVPAPMVFGGLVLRQSPSQPSEQAPPASVRQMVARYNEREKNNEIVARLILPTTAVSVDGEKLSQLPPTIDTELRSGRSSGVKQERDEVKVVEATDWVVSGAQVLTVNVQRKDLLEGGSPGAPPPGAAPAVVAPPAGPAATVINLGSVGDDEDEAVFAAPRRPQRKDSKPAASPKTAPQEPAKPAGPPKQAEPGKDAEPAKQPAPAVAAPPASGDSAKPVVRAVSVWRQLSRSDFAKGMFEGVSVTTQGDLALARSLKRLRTTGESFVWCLTSDGKDGLYAGTGNEGRILHVAADGTTQELANLPEVGVHALLRAPDGTLWAGTAPRGRVYRVSPDGKYQVAYQTPEKYVLALARDSRGNVYAGTGGGVGAVYRINSSGNGTPFFRTAEEHVLCLAAGQDDTLYAGTSTEGVVYRITPDGKGSVLYDAAEQSITAVGISSKGDLYAAAAPRGVLYRISPDGSAKPVYDKASAGLMALAIAPDDTVYVGGGNAAYAVRPDGTVAPLDNGSDVEILSLAVGPDGTLYAGTGNVAELYAAAPSSAHRSGVYESVVHDAKQPARWGSIRWSAAQPAGTRLQVQTRTGNVADPDASWSAWAEPTPAPEGGRVASPAARFIQYRVVLESESAVATPALREIALSYLAKNQAPKVSFQAPSGGERWAKQQTIRWEASDADKDTLSYELYYSADNGAHWAPLPAGTTTSTPGAPAQPSQPAAPSTATPAADDDRPPSVEEMQAALDKHPDLPAAMREGILERTREANARYQAAHPAGAAGQPSAAPGAPPAAAPNAATRQTSRTLETKALPDGSYTLKVVASDRPSNPSDPQTAEAVSEPFVVCNSAPVLTIVKSSVKVGADGVVSLEGAAAQKLIAVTAVQFRVDSGDWLAALPADGMFDTVTERFVVTTGPLSKGSHTVEVMAFNAAGTSTGEKVPVEVK